MKASGFPSTASGFPSGAAYNQTSKKLSWTPTFQDAGDYSVTVKASDGEDEVTKVVLLHVANENRAPTGSISASKTNLQAGESLSLTSDILLFHSLSTSILPQY